MVLDINKYCKPSKKRSLLQVLKIKWYKQQKLSARKDREWEAKFGNDIPTNIEKVYTIKESLEYFSNKKGWKNFLFAILFITLIPFVGIPLLAITCDLLVKNKETLLGILWLILYGIGWLIGIILTIFISKVSVCFLYRTSVSLAAKFVADVWEEVELKRERRKKEINDN